MITALVAGSLFRSAESRTSSKTGRQFVSATVRVKDGDGSRFVNVVAFSQTAQGELLRLQDGDSFSAQGPLTASIYTDADGNFKVYFSIVANHVLALRQPPKDRKPEAAAPDTRTRQERCAGTWTGESGDPNDSIDFIGDA